MKQYRKPGGFTLPELLITIGIVSIVLSLAVPAISSIVKDNRLVSKLNAVMTDIHFARSEAVKRDTRVILCRSALPTTSAPVCGGDARVWTTGYIIFADDGNYTNNVYDAGTDTLLRIGRPVTSGARLLTNGAWDMNLEFNPDGTTNEGGTVAIMSICDDRGKPDGRQIQVTPRGIANMSARNIATCQP